MYVVPIGHGFSFLWSWKSHGKSMMKKKGHPEIVTVIQTSGKTYHSVAEHRSAPPNRIHNPNPNVTRSGLPPEANGFFDGPCATFSQNFVKKIDRVVFA